MQKNHTNCVVHVYNPKLFIQVFSCNTIIIMIINIIMNNQLKILKIWKLIINIKANQKTYL